MITFTLILTATVAGVVLWKTVEDDREDAGPLLAGAVMGAALLGSLAGLLKLLYS